MKTFAAIAAMGFTQAVLAQNLLERIAGGQNIHVETDAAKEVLLPLSTRMHKNQFGCFIEEAVFENQYVEKTITAPTVPFHLDYAQQEQFINSATDFHKNIKANGPVPVYTCENRDPFGSKTTGLAFLPVFAGDVSSSNPTATYEGTCFEEITFEFDQTSDTTFDVLVHTDKPKSHLCSDTILFANTEIQHFEVFYFRGKHKLSFEMNSPETQADVGYGGI